jgi:hypothetical protein
MTRRITAADPKLRCELPATFHHVSAALHEQLFAFERTLNHSMTVSDVARAFLLEPLLRNATWQLGAHERAVVGANLPADDLQVIPLRRVLPLASIVERVVGDELWIEACASYCRQTQSCTGFVLERRGEMRCALKSRLIGRILFENVSESNRSSSTVVGVLEHRFACAAQTMTSAQVARALASSNEISEIRERFEMQFFDAIARRSATWSGQCAHGCVQISFGREPCGATDCCSSDLYGIDTSTCCDEQRIDDQCDCVECAKRRDRTRGSQGEARRDAGNRLHVECIGTT